MSNKPLASETVILLDDASIFEAAAVELRAVVREAAPGGTGFTQSRRFASNGHMFNLLLLNPADAHPFAYLTLCQRTMAVCVERVICIGAAASLREDHHPGDLALVRRATALPYPALYESKPPEWQQEPDDIAKAAVYQPAEESLQPGRHLISRIEPHLLQLKVHEVSTGYTKHPAWQGSMMPWAPEQLDQLRDAGLDTINEVTVGALEFAEQNPDVPVICFNLVTTRADELIKDSGGKLKSRRNSPRRTLLDPTVSLLVELLRDPAE